MVFLYVGSLLITCRDLPTHFCSNFDEKLYIRHYYGYLGFSNLWGRGGGGGGGGACDVSR